MFVTHPVFEAESEEIAEYLPLVRSVVRKMALPTCTILDADDLVSMGTIGLLQAKARYRPAQGAFVAFAVPRIRGAVLDGLRKSDTVTRDTRSIVRKINAAESQLLAETGETTDAELSAACGVSAERIDRARSASSVRTVSLDALSEGRDESRSLSERISDGSEDLLAPLLQRELVEEVAGALKQLPARDRTVLALRFAEGLTYKEIAEVLSVSESRISQLQSRAIFRLQRLMGLAA